MKEYWTTLSLPYLASVAIRLLLSDIVPLYQMLQDVFNMQHVKLLEQSVPYARLDDLTCITLFEQWRGLEMYRLIN